MLNATPHRFGPWLVPVAAPHKTAELREPAHGLAERRWTVRRCWTVRDGTGQRLPFRDRQQHATRHLGSARASMVAENTRQAITRSRVKQRCKRSPVPN